MPAAVRRVLVLVAVLLAVVAVGLWAYRTLGPQSAPPGPPQPEVATTTVAGVRFEVEHRPDQYAATAADDALTVVRGADVIEFADGYVTVNDVGLPAVQPGDVVRWNLEGPLLVNGTPQEPHPLQPHELDAAAAPLEWTPRPSQNPRDTLSVAWAGAGRVLVAAHGDGAVRVWDTDRGAVLKALVPDPLTGDAGEWGLRAAASPDGKTVAVTNINGEDVTLWDAVTGTRTATFSEPKGKVNSVQFGADTALLEARGGVVFARLDGNRSTVEEVGKVHTQFAPAFGYSATDGMLSCNNGQRITVSWVKFGTEGKDTRIARIVPEYQPTGVIENVTPAGCLALSADGKLLAVFNGTNRLTVRDPWTGKELHRLRWRAADRTKPFQITALAFTPDGKTLAVGDVGSVRFYDVASGREWGWVWANWVRALAYSADGRTLAAGLRYAPGLVLWATADLTAK